MTLNLKKKVALTASQMLAENTFTVTVCVPVGTRCELMLPDGTSQILASGTHTATCSIS